MNTKNVKQMASTLTTGYIFILVHSAGTWLLFVLTYMVPFKFVNFTYGVTVIIHLA